MVATRMTPIAEAHTLPICSENQLKGRKKQANLLLNEVELLPLLNMQSMLTCTKDAEVRLNEPAALSDFIFEMAFFSMSVLLGWAGLLKDVRLTSA